MATTPASSTSVEAGPTGVALAGPRHILLAVDVGADEPRLAERVARAVAAIAPGSATIEPVFVLSPEEISLAERLQNKPSELEALIGERIRALLGRCRPAGLQKPRVLVARAVTMRSRAAALTDYAARAGADLIALSTHARKGMKRLFLGSFAETLALCATVPLFLVRPGQRLAASRPGRVLFPTDFSAESKEALEAVVASLAGPKTEIVLFHQFETMARVYLEPVLALPMPPGTFQEELDLAEKRGVALRDELVARGVRARFVLGRKSVAPADAILAGARREKAGLIAMASQAGPASAVVFGSVTRQVIREAPCPVWVMPPRHLKRSR